MKKLLFLVCFALLLVSCAADLPEESTVPVSSAAESGIESSAAESSAEEPSADPMDGASRVISTTDYQNTGKMGDTDGPAFAVYSETGYTGASALLDLQSMEINTVMKDGRFVNGYIFFGIDVYDESGTWWQNCVDVGLCWSGRRGGWHVFYNLYEPLNEGTSTWYESYITLPKDDVYRMSLTITADNYALLTVEGVTGGVKDEVRVEVKGALASGSNTAFLFNTALDYPPDTKVDRNGNACEDFAEITLANTDQGLYLRSFRVAGLTLYEGETAVPWTDDKSAAVSIWPDKAVSGFDYAPTTVGCFDGTAYVIHLDMNRK